MRLAIKNTEQSLGVFLFVECPLLQCLILMHGGVMNHMLNHGVGNTA